MYLKLIEKDFVMTQTLKLSWGYYLKDKYQFWHFLVKRKTKSLLK